MRKPSEYIHAAMAKLRGSLIPDCSEVLRHGGRSAEVTRVGSLSRGGDSVTDSDVNENIRILADAADFPDLRKGCAVQLGDRWRIVTAARTDPARASLSVWLSDELEEIVADYRRPGTNIRQPLKVLAVESDTLDAWSDNLAPTACRAWLLAVSAEHWLEASDPQIGDEATIDGKALRVSAVAKHDGYWVLTCRARR